MRAWCWIGVALFAGGCNSRALGSDDVVPQPTPAAAIAFPLGTFTNCGEGWSAADGNDFLGTSGFVAGAALTLSERGTTLTARYADPNGIVRSLEFSPLAGTAASLAAAGQPLSAFDALCVMGIGASNESHYPATLDVTSGALTYQAGTVFLTAEGTVHADAGSCGPESSEAGGWIVCRERQGGAIAIDSTAASAPWPVGEHSCRTQVTAYGHADGLDQYVATGGSGTLALTQTGAALTATYRDDRWLSGTLGFVATTAATADGENDQSLMAPCIVPLVPGGGPLQPLPLTAASLTVDGATLFLSFAGTLAASSSCAGAQVSGSVICSK